jgi:hypothetical protein
VAAISDFSRNAGAQTAEVIALTRSLARLTQRMFWLAIAQIVIAGLVGIIAALQLVAAVN